MDNKVEIKKSIKKHLNTQPAYITSFKDGIATIMGLDNPKLNGIVKIGEQEKGLILQYDEKTTTVGILSKGKIKSGSFVEMTDQIISVKYSSQLLGKVVDYNGNPIDVSEDITEFKEVPIERNLIPLIDRQKVDRSLKTGILSIDCCIPIGRGQRELIIGDRETGKTQIAVDTMINQNDNNVINIYVAIEQKLSKIKILQDQLINNNAMDNTIIFVASSNDNMMSKYLIPFSATSVAEEFMLKGYDVVITYDDLTKHSEIYRSMSLLMNNPPGREAYPGDIFYLHSRLLERATCIEKGSITALPIIETQGGDISSFIATNIISITDGQIFTSSDLFQKGFKPSVDLGYSVSRIGSSAQSTIMKEKSKNILSQYIKYVVIEKNSIVGMDLIGQVKNDYENGKMLYELFKQDELTPMSEVEQLICLHAFKSNQLNSIDISIFKEKIKNNITQEFIQIIENKDTSNKELSLNLNKIIGISK